MTNPTELPKAPILIVGAFFVILYKSNFFVTYRNIGIPTFVIILNKNTYLYFIQIIIQYLH